MLLSMTNNSTHTLEGEHRHILFRFADMNPPIVFASDNFLRVVDVISSYTMKFIISQSHCWLDVGLTEKLHLW
jgi:hypothetical protein